MSTLRELIYDIKEMFSAYSDDILLSDEHLAFMIKTKRNTYLKNYISNLKKELPQQALQQICINLEEDELCEDNALFLKSTSKIPATLESTGRSNISQAFLNSRLAKWINIVNYERWPLIKSGGRYNHKQIYITLDPEDYLLVYSPSGNHELLEEIKLNNIFEDPEAAYNLTCDNSPECDFYDSEFPIPGDMISLIRIEILNELLVKYKIPVDVVNNAEDDTVNSNKLNARTRL